MQRSHRFATGVVSLALLGALATFPAQAQQAPPGNTILRTAFEKDTNGWISIGEKANVSLDSDTVTGTKFLRYDYAVEKGNFSILILPINENEVAAAQTIRFKVKTDYPTTLGVVLQEREADKDRGRYLAVLYSPGGEWQEVALSTTDFVLSQGKDDPYDPNGKLDMNLVQGVGLIDLKQMIAQGEDNPISDLMGLKRGSHKLWMKDFQITTEVLPGASFYSKSDSRLDTFGHPQVGWLGFGEVKLSTHTGSPIEGRGLKAVYPHGPGKIGAMVRGIPQGRLAGKQRLQLTLTSEKPTTVAVQVEERGGGKYNAVLDVPGGKTPKEFVVSFADFTPADDSKDDNNKLDLGEVHQVVLVDISGLLGSAKEAGENTLFINGLRALAN
ncbi:MAG: hypothetical protein OHK0029_07570 [Armatimonadaceae bacterium]